MNALMTDGYEVKTGDVVYLYEEIRNGVETLMARRTPLCTNVSHEPVLRGWCGETNNVSRFAVGAGIVSRISESESESFEWRLLVRKIKDSDPRIAESVRS